MHMIPTRACFESCADLDAQQLGKNIKNTRMKNQKGAQHNDLRALILYVEVPLLRDFSGKNPRI